MIVINNPTGVASGGILIGAVVLWYGSASAVPYGYAICNGAGGTLDLRGKMILGANNAGDLLTTGGSATHLHSGGSVGSAGSHNHGYNSTTSSAESQYNNGSVSSAPYATVANYGHTHAIGGGDSDNGGDHTHTSSGISGIASSIPAHKKLYWVKRLL